MNILVVYYSRTGKTRRVGQSLAAHLEANYEEIIDLKNRKGFFGWLGAGRDAFRKKMTRIQETKYNPQDYDLIIIGTPIWAGMPAPGIRTYLHQNQEKIKNIAFFCTHGGGNTDKVFSELETVCQKKPKAVLGLMSKEVDNNQFLEKLQSFIEKIRT